MKKLAYSLLGLGLWQRPCNSIPSSPCESSSLAQASTDSPQSSHQNSPWIWRNYNRSKQEEAQTVEEARDGMDNTVDILSISLFLSFIFHYSNIHSDYISSLHLYTGLLLFATNSMHMSAMQIPFILSKPLKESSNDIVRCVRHPVLPVRLTQFRWQPVYPHFKTTDVV